MSIEENNSKLEAAVKLRAHAALDEAGAMSPRLNEAADTVRAYLSLLEAAR